MHERTAGDYDLDQALETTYLFVALVLWAPPTAAAECSPTSHEVTETPLSTLWQFVVALVGGFVVLWLTLVLALYLAGRKLDKPTRLRDALRLVPDIIGMLRRMATDPRLSRGVRIRLSALLVYLILPIDLIPDFIPVIGYADDIIMVIVTIRSVARRAGVDAIDRHWTGTPDGLHAVKQLAGLDH